MFYALFPIRTEGLYFMNACNYNIITCLSEYQDNLRGNDRVQRCIILRPVPSERVDRILLTVQGVELISDALDVSGSIYITTLSLSLFILSASLCRYMTLIVFFFILAGQTVYLCEQNEREIFWLSLTKHTHAKIATVCVFFEQENFEGGRRR